MEVWRDELYHHGIKGQKWGIRRYQNPDGSLTSNGRKRLQRAANEMTKRYNSQKKLYIKMSKKWRNGVIPEEDYYKLVKHGEKVTRKNIERLGKLPYESAMKIVYDSNLGAFTIIE